jgi:ADP-ribose pyrophosphatase YjhB (NUDIX family)
MNRATYTYCPQCATPLTQRQVYGHLRAVCPGCGFIHFQDPKVAVIGLVTCGAKVLLIQRAIDPAKGQWALPGGYMDAGEMPTIALQRELHEEVALGVKVLRLLEIFPMVVGNQASQGIVLAYHAEPVDSQQTALTCDTELRAAGWFSADALPADLAFESTHVLLARWQQGNL